MASPEQAGTPPGQTRDDLIRKSLFLGRGEPLPDAEKVAVHELVAAFARTRPTATAVSSGGSSVDYGTLDTWAGRVADRLAGADVGQGSRVAVLVEASTAMVVAVLGVLRRGATYVPLDPAQPDRRIADLLADARVTAAVVTHTTAHRLSGLGIPLVHAEAADESDSETGAAPRVPAGEEDGAYLVYTSGTTGEPKGVLVQHGALTASTLARRMVYPGASVFLLVSPLAFDSSAAGLWGTLTTGGNLVVATPDEIRDPSRLVALIEEYRVTRLLCVPSLYSVILDAAERLGGHPLCSLTTVIVAGEALPEPLVERHFAVHSGPVTLVNEYGPTEATVWASHHRFEAPGAVSIGVPIPGANLYVLDDRLHPVPFGGEGELFIGGAGVSRGYFGRPDATARVFVEDPFATTSGSRMYRTGDRVRWNDDGTLHFIGRRDHQVKIRGHRIELGAVEAALRSLPEVDDAVVVPDGTRSRLAGFVIASDGVTSESLRRQLTDRLPAAMVPAQIQAIARFPLTANGKIDRARLSAMADEYPHPSLAPVTPAASGTETDLSRQVAAAWAEILKLTDVPTEVNFFDLGGNSLAMFKLQSALEEHTGIRPSVVALFQHTTVSAQATLILNGGAASGESASAVGPSAVQRARALRARRQRTERERAK